MLSNPKVATSIGVKYSRLLKPTKIDACVDLGLIFMLIQSTTHYPFKPRTILVCSAGR